MANHQIANHQMERSDEPRRIARKELDPNPKIPALAAGDLVRVHQRIVEGERERIQVFQGTVIRLRSGGANANFTVRRLA